MPDHDRAGFGLGRAGSELGQSADSNCVVSCAARGTCRCCDQLYILLAAAVSSELFYLSLVVAHWNLDGTDTFYSLGEAAGSQQLCSARWGLADTHNTLSLACSVAESRESTGRDHY
jgi:hypothetical protein